MRYRLLPAVALLLCSPVVGADWKPAPAPLMTKWGKKVTPENTWKEYPRPQLVRKEWQNLNGLWDYAITKKDAPKPETWDGKILVPFCAESALSGVGKPVGPDDRLWYRREIDASAWKGRRVMVHFGAVDWQATVWLNGKPLGTHTGGNDPFSFDITDALKDGSGELVVQVYDPTDSATQPRGKQIRNPHGIWYTPVTGIWQTAWMEPVASDAHIRGVRVTPDIDKGEVEFVVDAVGMGSTVDIGDKTDTGVKVRATGKPGEPIRLKVENPKLWTPDSPHLYDVTVLLHSDARDSTIADTVTTYFAMRKISAAKDDKGVLRLMLNNKPLFQYGPLDQGWWPDGLLTPPSDEAMKYDLEVLKKLGFNMLRKHIKVEPARYYRYCDEMGLLVWQDMPSGGVPSRGHLIPPGAKEDAKFADAEKKVFRDELKAMIDHLRFFPSIVVWVPFNEGWGQHDTNDILKWTKQYDPTRLVNGPSGWEDRGFGDMKDAHIYPGPGMFPVMPDRVSVLGEFGGLGLPVPGHLWKNTNNWGYRTYKTEQELRDNYRVLMRRLHPLVGKGLAAAVYTQTTDVEVEVNGFITYDREVIKFDVAETAKWHKALYDPAPELRDIVPTSEGTPQKWRFTTDKPAAGWEKPDFDAAKWTEANAGFGTKGTPGGVIRTEWKTNDIWLRRAFDLKELPAGEMQLSVHHDEDVEVYINGVLALRASGFTTGYTEYDLTPEGRKALKAGTNVIAVRCKQTGGGQYIDAGLVEFVPPKK
ncbi:Beta-galactosidase [Gemmata obscuriglobus]|uniref:Glycoside hydrolase family 2 n=1 Tax=Gemmata obscuriglobus TaxID=114 RepID=A0A2Z3GZ14_9BACT|nr:glycoside hydrolase family 2 [Gemmata obscuriglobus]AWM37302.1 glycoside hydrolase family 2 [Gemmata obscuriglobus]QEG29950.1 Beta-galactosidase [Gemmata obscuriglobus]VTS09269.1 beta-galactosidase : Glycoside hydrolase family 2 sugar binding OS=Pedosphaera parvula (strain Ellin514) GN=Cflav_PD5438 PE=4 SV=1: Glyco_hydro_2_N: Glyco_hydro_2: Glyco_hydro_2_C [Gemmata obscuriglobus UQM 2246]